MRRRPLLQAKLGVRHQAFWGGPCCHAATNRENLNMSDCRTEYQAVPSLACVAHRL